MKAKKVKIDQIVESDDNPRIIRSEKFKKLCQSIKDFPKMLELRPIVVDKDMKVLGGNMRLRACKEIGLKEVFILDASELSEEEQRQFMIKDNVSFGEWDWDQLANTWENELLNEWGLDVWMPPKSEEFNPSLEPDKAGKSVELADFDKVKVGYDLKDGKEGSFIEVMCSECGHEFNIEAK